MGLGKTVAAVCDQADGDAFLAVSDGARRVPAFECAGSICRLLPAARLGYQAMTSGSNRRAAFTPSDLLTVTSCSARSIGGISGAVRRRLNRNQQTVSTSASPAPCCRVENRNRRA